VFVISKAMKNYLKKLLAVCLPVILVSSIGCSTSGPVERAGEKLDDADDNVKEGQSPFHKKGAAEKTGEAIDEAIGNK